MADYRTTISYNVDVPDPDMTMTTDVSLICTEDELSQVNSCLAEASEALSKGWPYGSRFGFLSDFFFFFMPVEKTDGKILVRNHTQERLGDIAKLLSFIKEEVPAVGFRGKAYMVNPYFGRRGIWTITSRQNSKEIDVVSSFESDIPGATHVDPPKITTSVKVENVSSGKQSSKSNARSETAVKEQRFSSNAKKTTGNSSKAASKSTGSANAKKTSRYANVVVYGLRESIDQDVLESVAIALIFKGEPATADWVCGVVDGIESENEAKRYLAVLLDADVVGSDSEGSYWAEKDYPTFMRDWIDGQLAELEAEGAYELIVSSIAGQNDYIELDEIVSSIEGLPKRDVVKGYLLEGVKKGDLARRGSNLSFRCAMGDEARIAWLEGYPERCRKRASQEKALLSRKKSVGANGELFKAAKEQYAQRVKNYERTEAERLEREQFEKVQKDEADIQAIIEAIEGYSFGNGYVSCDWIKNKVPAVRSSKRAKELAECAWTRARLRKSFNDEGELYARLLTEGEWADAKRAADKRCAAEDKKRNNRHRKTFERECAEQLDSAQKMVEGAQRRKASAEGKCATLERQIAEAKQVRDQLKGQLSDLDGEIERLTSELDALGLLAVGKKKALRTQIAETEAKRNDCRAKADEASQKVKKLKTDLNSAKGNVSGAESDLMDAQERLSKCEERLSKGAGDAEIAPRDYAIRALEYMKLWGAPVSWEWIADNVPGIKDANHARNVFESRENRLLLSEVSEGRFVASEHSEGASSHVEPLRVGSTVKFGKRSFGAKDVNLTWRVMEVDEAEGKALILCDYALKDAPFSRSLNNCNWEASTLASWLNGEFLNEAFTKAERERILSAPEPGPDNPAKQRRIQPI